MVERNKKKKKEGEERIHALKEQRSPVSEISAGWKSVVCPLFFIEFLTTSRFVDAIHLGNQHNVDKAGP